MLVIISRKRENSPTVSRAHIAKVYRTKAAKLKADIKEDTKSVFEKYLSISGWDVPENDEKASQELIVAAMQEALDELKGS